MEIEHNKNVGPVSTIMPLLTSKDDDLSSYFDKKGESVLDNDNPLKQILFNNHAVEVKKGKVKGQLALEHTFGFCEKSKKKTSWISSNI